MRRIAIVDYGSGNLRSAAKAFERAAREGGHDALIEVTDRPDLIASADAIVLPGVGAFGDCAAGVRAVEGLREALDLAVIGKGRPFLGICVGLQLMAERGLEHGIHDGFGWLSGEIAALRPDDPALKIPHMGWNTLHEVAAHPVLSHVRQGGHAYFVHSYAWTKAKPDQTYAWCPYGGQVPAILGRDNMIGTQFHPEKSQGLGLGLIERFLAWRP